MEPSMRIVVATAVGLLVVLSLLAQEPPKPTRAQLDHFEQNVLPILKASCFKCHGAEGKPKAGLSLITREGILEGGDTEPAVNLKDPAKSLLLKAINHEGGLQMPPTGKMTPAKIAALEKWVKDGIPWPSHIKIEVKEHVEGGKVTAESKNYWAYKPVINPPVPAVKNAAWVKTPIDAFILAKLEAKNLSPSVAASKLHLIRRAYYDLIGLPPTPEEIDSYVKDSDPAAYEKLIDKLLAMPQFGEKWARHWLDVVRYAETNGYERDGPKPYAWRFRDYVIKSLNDDKPYDQFVREQLAGDELPNASAEAIIATGFYRLGLWDDEPADPKQARFDEMDDIVATTAQGFLGMTMNCARCHDHKIDPIPQKDYYQMLAFFADIERFSLDRNTRSPYNLTDISPPEKRKLYEEEFSQRQKKIAELKTRMEKMEDQIIKRMPAEDQRASETDDRHLVVAKLDKFWKDDEKKNYTDMKKEQEQLKKKPEPSRDLALSVNKCKVNPPQTFVMLRGSPHSPGAKVSPGFPSVLTDKLPELKAPDKDARSSGRRTIFANWVTSKDNPLTARVIVNRLWQHHLGKGIVASSNDFGKFGTPPTHPELLDWLATDFMANGWKMKRVHKMIMMSNVYQQASLAGVEPSGRRGAVDNKAANTIDPENNLYWRANPRRLTAEEVRDTILHVNGTLNLKAGGPSIYPIIPREVLAGQSVPGQGWGKSSAEEASRRSIYVYVKRSLQVPILVSHDQADPDSTCPVRYTTTVPTQALGMLNSDFTNDMAAKLANRVEKEKPGEVRAQIARAIRLTTGRVPGDAEVQKDLDLLDRFKTKHGMNDQQALKQTMLMLLNANEMVYLD
jgi:mono/diheme cytochrome c family protein